MTSAVPEVTPLQIATLVIAVCGLVLSVAALTWQIAQFLLAGYRVRVELLVGAVGRGGIVTGPMSADPGIYRNQGFTEPVVVVRARNVGRQPVSITNYGVGFSNGASVASAGSSLNPDLPYRLEPGASVDFHTPLDLVSTAGTVMQTANTSGPRRIRGSVTLATGKPALSEWEQVRP